MITSVKIYGKKNWKRVAEELNTRTPVQCLHRWTKILKPGLRKGTWTKEEDRKLLEWVRCEGPCKWSQCADYIKGRTGKQIRERWFNTLNPNVVKGNWSAKEDELIFKMFASVGSKWSKIAEVLPGRTENSIKNRFYSTLRRIEGEVMKSKTTFDSEGIDNSCKSSKKCTSLNSLLKYFPIAYEEKTKNNLLQSTDNRKQPHKRNSEGYDENNCNFINISSSSNMKFPDNVNKKFDYDINQMNYIIDNYNLTDLNIDDTRIRDIENKLNNFIKEYKDLNANNSLVELEKNETVLGNFVDQLGELETILKKAKSEISQQDLNNLPVEKEEDNLAFEREFNLSYPFVTKDEPYMGVNLNEDFSLDSVEDFYKF